MFKFFIPLAAYPYSNDHAQRARRVTWLFLLPVILYILLRLFEDELTALIIPFFPVESDKSVGFYRDLIRLCSNELLWITFFLLTTWVLHHYVQLHPAINESKRASARSPVVVIIVTLVLSLLVARYVLQGFPNSADEYVYLHQAETLSSGKLVQEAHPLRSFFHFNHLAHKEGLTVGRFPPGWPLLLSLPFLLNIPAWWLNPLLSVLTLWLFYKFARHFYGHRVAMWSLISLALTGFFIFNGASYFSHVSCLLFTVAFVYCTRLYQEKKLARYALLAGVSLGMVVIIRYLTAVLIFLPFLLALLYELRWRAARPLAMMGLGALPLVGFLLWYNFQITGNPLLPVTVWVDPAETLGFVKGHTPLKGMEHLVRRALLFLYWSSPALLVLYLIFLVRKITRKHQRLLHPEDYFLILLFAGYFFYHHPGGNQYGPRFLFEGYPFAVAFVVQQVLSCRAKWPVALWLAGIVYAVVKLPYISEREHRVVTERTDLYRQVQEADLSQAVVFIATHTGIIRPMPPGDLTRNGMDYQREVIYARDLGEKNVELMDFYPDRRFYVYTRDPEQVEGQLVKIR